MPMSVYQVSMELGFTGFRHSGVREIMLSDKIAL